MAKIYTKTGDKGQTSLFGGTRVDKKHIRVDCYGTVDEAISVLGLAYSTSKHEDIKEKILYIQKQLFIVGAELASDEKGLEMLTNKVGEPEVKILENIIDSCYEVTGEQKEFIIPGKTTSSSALHIARTIIRRAERKVLILKETDDVREELSKYINRLSDTLFALARLDEAYINLRKDV